VPQLLVALSQTFLIVTVGRSTRRSSPAQRQAAVLQHHRRLNHHSSPRPTACYGACNSSAQARLLFPAERALGALNNIMHISIYSFWGFMKFSGLYINVIAFCARNRHGADELHAPPASRRRAADPARSPASGVSPTCGPVVRDARLKGKRTIPASSNQPMADGGFVATRRTSGAAARRARAEQHQNFLVRSSRTSRAARHQGRIREVHFRQPGLRGVHRPHPRRAVGQTSTTSTRAVAQHRRPRQRGGRGR
jgi:hypothetical protein